MIEEALTIAYLKFERIKTRQAAIKIKSKSKNAIHNIK